MAVMTNYPAHGSILNRDVDHAEHSDIDGSPVCEGEGAAGRKNKQVGVGTKGPKGVKLGRSRPRRGTKPSATVKDKDFHVDVAPRRFPNLKAKLLKYVCAAGVTLRQEAKLHPSEKSQEDVLMIKSGKMYATLNNCYSVASSDLGGVDDNIRLQSEVGYPSGCENCNRLANSYSRSFVDTPAERFQVVFVPVLQRGHWWCAAFCVNTEEVWITDSIARRPVDCHLLFLHKLRLAMDYFFKAVDETWMMGKVATWPVKAVIMEVQMNGDSCGVRMLLAIKACVDRYKTEFKLQSCIEEERGWLLNDDVLDDENEVKAEVKKLLQSYDL